MGSASPQAASGESTTDWITREKESARSALLHRAASETEGSFFGRDYVILGEFVTNETRNNFTLTHFVFIFQDLKPKMDSITYWWLNSDVSYTVIQKFPGKGKNCFKHSLCCERSNLFLYFLASSSNSKKCSQRRIGRKREHLSSLRWKSENRYIFVS